MRSYIVGCELTDTARSTATWQSARRRRWRPRGGRSCRRWRSRSQGSLQWLHVAELFREWTVRKDARGVDVVQRAAGGRRMHISVVAGACGRPGARKTREGLPTSGARRCVVV